MRPDSPEARVRRRLAGSVIDEATLRAWFGRVPRPGPEAVARVRARLDEAGPLPLAPKGSWSTWVVVATLVLLPGSPQPPHREPLREPVVQEVSTPRPVVEPVVRIPAPPDERPPPAVVVRPKDRPVATTALSTREAVVHGVPGTVELHRSPLGTRVTVTSQARARCLAPWDPAGEQILEPGDVLSCRPVSEPGMLGRAWALHDAGAPTSAVVAEIEEVLGSADASTATELQLLAIEALRDVQPCAAAERAKAALRRGAGPRGEVLEDLRYTLDVRCLEAAPPGSSEN